jgi:hypothetical protein
MSSIASGQQNSTGEQVGGLLEFQDRGFCCLMPSSLGTQGVGLKRPLDPTAEVLGGSLLCIWALTEILADDLAVDLDRTGVVSATTFSTFPAHVCVTSKQKASFRTLIVA